MVKVSQKPAFHPTVVQGGILERTPPSYLSPPPYLRAVPSPAILAVHTAPASSALAAGASRQLSFRLIDPASLVVVDMRHLKSSKDFESLLTAVNPRVIFDVRPCPVLELDKHMDRPRAFALFETIAARYYDTTGRLNIETSDDARLNPAWMGVALSALLSEHSSGGPVVILVSGEERAADYRELLPKYLRPMPKGGWTVLSPKDVALLSSVAIK